MRLVADAVGRLRPQGERQRSFLTQEIHRRQAAGTGLKSELLVKESIIKTRRRGIFARGGVYQARRA